MSGKHDSIVAVLVLVLRSVETSHVGLDNGGVVDGDNNLGRVLVNCLQKVNGDNLSSLVIGNGLDRDGRLGLGRESRHSGLGDFEVSSIEVNGADGLLHRVLDGNGTSKSKVGDVNVEDLEVVVNGRKALGENIAVGHG